MAGHGLGITVGYVAGRSWKQPRGGLAYITTCKGAAPPFTFTLVNVIRMPVHGFHQHGQPIETCSAMRSALR